MLAALRHKATYMGFWLDTKKSRLVLSLIIYALYMLLYIVTDEQAREFYFGGYPLWGYVVDAAPRSYAYSFSCSFPYSTAREYTADSCRLPTRTAACWYIRWRCSS